MPEASGCAIVLWVCYCALGVQVCSGCASVLCVCECAVYCVSERALTAIVQAEIIAN